MNHHAKNLYDHLLSVLSSRRFLSKQGLGNEVPFFICPYDPSKTNEVTRIVGQLLLNLKTMNIPVLRVDLYDLTIELLKARSLWDKILEKETVISKAELKELLQGVLDAEVHLIPAISKKMKSTEFQILFLTGVGEVFPYIRSHNVLNNLQRIAEDQPTLMFFPGEYNHSEEDGAVLQLFNRLRDDRYYRAFNIFQYEV
jgi:hypothetical protein